MSYHVGMDLHSNNVIGVMIDESERWVLKHKFRRKGSVRANVSMFR